MKPYPQKVCGPCAYANGAKSRTPESRMKIDICDVCQRKCAVTEPQAYAFPSFKGHEARTPDVG